MPYLKLNRSPERPRRLGINPIPNRVPKGTMKPTAMLIVSLSKSLAMHTNPMGHETGYENCLKEEYYSYDSGRSQAQKNCENTGNDQHDKHDFSEVKPIDEKTTEDCHANPTQP